MIVHNIKTRPTVHSTRNTIHIIYIAHYTLYATRTLNTTRYSVCGADTARYTLSDTCCTPDVARYMHYAHTGSCTSSPRHTLQIVHHTLHIT